MHVRRDPEGEIPLEFPRPQRFRDRFPLLFLPLDGFGNNKLDLFQCLLRGFAVSREQRELETAGNVSAVLFRPFNPVGGSLWGLASKLTR